MRRDVQRHAGRAGRAFLRFIFTGGNRAVRRFTLFFQKINELCDVLVTDAHVRHAYLPVFFKQSFDCRVTFPGEILCIVPKAIPHPPFTESGIADKIERSTQKWGYSSAGRAHRSQR
jgi:hypothetical protein